MVVRYHLERNYVVKITISGFWVVFTQQAFELQTDYFLSQGWPN